MTLIFLATLNKGVSYLNLTHFNLNLISFILIVAATATSCTVSAMTGKLVMAAAFATLHVYAAELFPTVIRNMGIGTACLLGSLAAIIASKIDATAVRFNPCRTENTLGKIKPTVKSLL